MSKSIDIDLIPVKSIIKNLSWGYTLLLFITQIDDVRGHGGMLEPPMRSIAWRYGFDAPVNYDWMGLFCGGLHTFQQNGGRCGLCGDPYQGPYENDRGGVYDTGIIVRHYPAGLREIEVKVELTAHHKGYFRFKLCPNNDKALTERCLDRYPLQIREGRTQGDPYKYYPPKSPKLSELHVILPPDVACDRCVLQWTYTAGNNAGTGTDGKSCIGCGIQETFVNCADISIGGTRDKIPVSKVNGSLPRAGAEVVLPESPDIVNIIRNAPTDRSLSDFFQNLQSPGNQRQSSGRSRTLERPQPARVVLQNDPWAFDRTSDFGASNLPSQVRDLFHSDFLSPNSQQTTPQTNFDSQFSSEWDGHLGFGNEETSLHNSAMDRSFGQGRHRTQDHGHATRHTARSQPSRRLDFAGMNDPTIRDALDNHFGQPSLTEEQFLPTERPLTSRDGFHRSRGAPPPSAIPETRHGGFDTFDRSPGTMTNDRVITSEGHHSSLLGSLDPIVSEISRRGHSGRASRRPYRDSVSSHLSVPGEKYFKTDQVTPPTDAYDTHPQLTHRRISSRPRTRAVVHSSSYLHDKIHPRRASRPSQTLGKIGPAPRAFRTRPDVRHIASSRSRSLPRSSESSQRSLSRSRGHVSSSFGRRPDMLPRKIVVHDVDVAQHLLKRFPVLRGRVYLSSRAHRYSKYAGSSHRYRHRSW